jgi:hypothetical protein
VGLPRRTGFEDQLGHRTLPLQDGDRTGDGCGARQYLRQRSEVEPALRRQDCRPADLPVPEHLCGSREVDDVASVEALFATEERDRLGSPSPVGRCDRSAGAPAVTEPALFA